MVLELGDSLIDAAFSFVAMTPISANLCYDLWSIRMSFYIRVSCMQQKQMFMKMNCAYIRVNLNFFRSCEWEHWIASAEWVRFMVDDNLRTVWFSLPQYGPFISLFYCFITICATFIHYINNCVRRKGSVKYQTSHISGVIKPTTIDISYICPLKQRDQIVCVEWYMLCGEYVLYVLILLGGVWKFQIHWKWKESNNQNIAIYNTFIRKRVYTVRRRDHGIRICSFTI